MLKKLKLLKKPLFQKRRWSCDFPPRKTLVAQKHPAIPTKKRWHSLPTSGCLGTSLPLPLSLCGRKDVRTYGRTDVRTDGHLTITSEPKIIGLIVYQISLAMELRWRALPSGSAINSGEIPSRSEIWGSWSCMPCEYIYIKRVGQTSSFLNHLPEP